MLYIYIYMKINLIKNNLPTTKPIKEIMSIFIADIDTNLPNRNGSIYILVGSPGSGKTNLLYSTLFSNKKYYRGKFDNIYLFTPYSSFSSLEKHPFADHNKVYHELDIEQLENIYTELQEFKIKSIENETPLEYSCIIIDDFADDLKEISIQLSLKKMLLKSRHINCFFIFTLQTYNLFPLMLRKWVTNLTLFKTKNNLEMEEVRKELLNMNRNDFEILYNYVFDKPYNHLDFDTATMEVRKNFQLLEIEK